MPSIISHAIVGPALGSALADEFKSIKFWLVAVLCSIIPDADVIAFKFGIPYNHVLGHRGFSHSIMFALILGILVTFIFFNKYKFSSLKFWKLAIFFFTVTIIHSLLDAMTSGGLGVALFAPFNNTRFFFPFRPIQVSPIGINRFFSEWGLRVLISEFVWIWIPCLLFTIISRRLKFISKPMTK